MRALGLVWVLCLFTGVAAAAAVPPAQLPERIAIGIVADNEPYSSDGPHGVEGFSIDILDAVSRQTGIAFDYRVGSWADVYAAFLRGDLDAVDEISWRADRAERMLFTRPYHVRQTVIMHDVNRPVAPVESLDDLRGLRVGVLKDIYYVDKLQAAGLELSTYTLQSEIVRALAYGWVDVIVGAEVTLSYFARQEALASVETLGPAPLDGMEQEDFRIAVPLDRPTLQAELDDALAALDPVWVARTIERWREYGGRGLRQSGFRLSASQQSAVRQQGPVRVGLMPDYAPLSFDEKGALRGLTVDVLARVQDLTGLRVVPVVDQWPALMAMFERGEIDVMADISAIPERAGRVRFTEPYHHLAVVGFSREPGRRQLDPRGMAGQRVGYAEGIFYEAALRRDLGDQAVPYGDQVSLFRALEAGDVDLVLAALVTGNHWIRELGLRGVHVAGELELDGIVREDLRFGLRPGLEPLVPVFDAALAGISATEMRVIENRWLGASLQPPSRDGSRPVWTDQEAGWLARRGQSLIYCAQPDWMPIEAVSADGEHRGMAASLLQTFAGRSELRFDAWPVADARAGIAALEAGECDFLSALPAGWATTPNLALSRPYLQLPTVVLGRLQTPFMQRFADLDGSRVGITRDLGLLEELQTRYPGVRWVPVSDEPAGLVALQRGELDAYVGTLASTSLQLQELGMADVRVIGRVPGDTGLTLATRAADDTLTGILQKLVATVGARERSALEAQWRTVQIEERLDLRQFWQVLVITFAILALLFYWNRKLNAVNRELALANRKLALASVTDTLTGIANRTHFDRAIETTFEQCRRERLPLFMVMIDADHFKRVNDRWGHRAGDRCLQVLARLMQEHFNGSDEHVTRFGGEEFAIFGVTREPDAVAERLEGLRVAVAAEAVPVGDERIALGVSIGWCLATPGADSSVESWVAAADRALYRAKAEGRNRVMRGRIEPAPVDSPVA